MIWRTGVRFAFLIMGDFDSSIDKAAIHDGSAQIIGVSDMQQAIEEARRLEKEGIGCIELCGAFGEENARRIIEVTGNRIPIGHIVHLPEQDEIYRMAFAADKQG